MDKELDAALRIFEGFRQKGTHSAEEHGLYEVTLRWLRHWVHDRLPAKVLKEEEK